ncbi:thioredoxin domain-containing protein [Lentzea sp. NPDC042327]|uniref:DsbA family protein n=1 Tax=Lentzea sp. NPDC042327 TaxID=3154801 RepID=UPI0033EEF162
MTVDRELLGLRSDHYLSKESPNNPRRNRMSRTKKNPVTARRGVSLNVVLTAVVVLLAAAVFGGVLLFQRDGAEDRTAVLVPAGAHTLSKVDGDRVVLVEFLDFQCPACSAYYSGVTRKLEDDYRGRVTIVPRNLPLEMHPLALPAAQAAEAAGRQGKYAEMYHALYGNYDRWAVDGQNTSADRDRAIGLFEQFATAAGLDLDRFRADMASADVRAAIDRDVADARKLGVQSTPTLFLNGEQFQPSGKSFADVDRELRAKIDAALAG